MVDISIVMAMNISYGPKNGDLLWDLSIGKLVISMGIFVADV